MKRKTHGTDDPGTLANLTRLVQRLVQWATLVPPAPMDIQNGAV